jgi:hypothetical protein
VQVATLDILTHRAHFDPEVARAIGDAIDVEMNASRDNLATKSELKEEIASLRFELKKEIAEFRAEVRAEFTSIRVEYKRDLSECKADMIRWMFSAMVGQTMLLVGLMYFLLQTVH